MSRVFKLYLEDILECCANVRDYTAEMDFEMFSTDKKTIDAVVRNLEIIGEAVKNLPDDIRRSKPDIEWKKIARFRDIIVHHYFNVDLEVIWDILENRIEEIQQAVQEIVSTLEEES